MASSDCIDNYNVQYSIGHGGFGNVYKAEHRFTGQKVAIKFIEKKKIQNHSGMLKRVLQEVAIHSRLKHPSILEVYNYFEDVHYIYLILELCPHGDLNTRLKTHSSGFPEYEVRNYMQQITEGIIYLQKHKILHRDLTLSNILISRHGTVKIADFGLATQLQDVNEKHFTMCGTPNYISPEVAMRLSHGLESDVWSIGCMFYAMLTGRPPFDGHGVKGTLEKVKSGEYYLPGHLTNHAKHLIKSLLQMKPEDRLKLEHILSHPFFTNPASSMRTEMSLDSGRGTFLQSSATCSTSNIKYKPQLDLMSFKNTLKETTDSITKSTMHPKTTEFSMTSLHNAFNAFSLSTQNSSKKNKHDTKSTSSIDVACSDDDDDFKLLLSSRSIDSSAKNLLEARNTTSEPKYHAFNSSSSYFFTTENTLDSDSKLKPVSGEVYKEDICNRNLLSKNKNAHSLGKTDLFTYVRSTSTPLFTTAQTSSLFDRNSVKSGFSRTTPIKSKISGTTQTIKTETLKKRQSKLSNSVNNLLHELSSHALSKASNSIQYKNSKFSSMENIANNKNDFHNDLTIMASGEDTLRSPVQTPDRSQVWTTVNISIDSSAHDVNTKQERIKSYTQERSKRDLFQYFSTTRLRPMRQKTKNAVITILEDGYVVAEFFKIFDNVERTKRIMKVSPDGTEIYLFETDDYVNTSFSSSTPLIFPTTSSGNPIYHPTCLPQGWRKKFEYLSRFINLVRSKTPKITLYTGKAKCMVMENMPTPDFQVDFYSGCQFTVATDCTKILQCDGTTLTMTSNAAFSHLSPDLQIMWKHVQEAHIMCNKFEMLVPKSDSAGFIPCFPLTIGRKSGMGSLTSTTSSNSPRSTTSNESSTNAFKMTSSCSENNIVKSSNISRKKSASNFFTELPADPTSLQHQKVNKRWPANVYVRKQVSIPKTLIASELSNGTIIIKHEDKSEVCIDCKSLQIQYKDQDGQVFTFKNDNCLPSHVMEKMKDLPTVMSMLQQTDYLSLSVKKDRDDCFV